MNAKVEKCQPRTEAMDEPGILKSAEEIGKEGSPFRARKFQQHPCHCQSEEADDHNDMQNAPDPFKADVIAFRFPAQLFLQFEAIDKRSGQPEQGMNPEKEKCES